MVPVDSTKPRSTTISSSCDALTSIFVYILIDCFDRQSLMSNLPAALGEPWSWLQRPWPSQPASLLTSHGTNQNRSAQPWTVLVRLLITAIPSSVSSSCSHHWLGQTTRSRKPLRPGRDATALAGIQATASPGQRSCIVALATPAA